MCILAIEFSFTEKLTGIPWGGGQQGLWANFRKWVHNLLGDLSRVLLRVPLMTSFRMSHRVSFKHCRTWCPMGSSQREQLFSRLGGDRYSCVIFLVVLKLGCPLLLEPFGCLIQPVYYVLVPVTPESIINGLDNFCNFSPSPQGGPLADSFCQGALFRSSSKAWASVFYLSLSWKLSWSALTSAGVVSCVSYPVSFGKSGG